MVSSSTAARSSPRTAPRPTLFLVYVRFGPGVGGIGSVLIERGTPGFAIGEPSSFMSGEQWCPLYLRQLPDSRAQISCSATGGFKKQIEGFNVERIGNSVARDRVGPSRVQRRARVRDGAQAVRPAAVRVPGPAVEVRRDGGEARCRAVAALSRERQCARTACPRPTTPPSPSWPATTPAGRSQRSAAGHGRHGFQQGKLVEYCVRRTRGWMIAGGSIEILKNRIAESVFDRRFDQRQRE